MSEFEKSYECRCGVKIYSYKNPSLHSFGISLFLRAGEIFEGENESGITHFLEHALIRNVNKLEGGKMYSRLDKLGIEFNAGTYSEMVQFYTGGSVGHFGFAADMITKLLSPIVLNAGEIDAERRRIKAEIRENDDKTSLSTFSSSIIYSGTPLSRSIVGTNSSVDAITLKRLEEYRKRVCTSGGMFFYVTGNFTDHDVETLARLIDSYDIPEAEAPVNAPIVPKLFGNRPSDVYIKNADFTMVRFTFDLDMKAIGVPVTDVLYDMLLTGYSSRMFMEMSEKRGLFYDVTGAMERFLNIGTFYFTFEVKERDVYEAIELVCDILNSFKSDITEQDCIRAGYVDNAMMLYDDQREMNFTYAYDNHIMGLGYATVEQRRSAYSSVSAENVMNAADKIFRRENLTLTMKANKKRINKDRILEILRRL